jgi:iron(III) transport system ATP-binding protein
MEITLDAVTKSYEGSESSQPALSDVSATIGSGEFFFLLGPSGCGKTTLLRVIAGLIQPTAGRIMFDGRDVTELPVDKRGTALVFQGYALWPHMTVRENVEFGPKMKGLPRKTRRRLALEQLTRVEMTDFMNRKPNQLSGGQQQRVALARALAAGTQCLLFDEPLSNLDARLRLTMRDELKTLVKSTGVTAIYVTHDQKEALSMADRVAVMKAGEIIQLDSPEAIYSQPATHFVADFLGEANLLDGMVSTPGDSNKLVLDTQFGEIVVSAGDKHPPGSSVTCCVRPEHVRIQRTDVATHKDTDNVLPAKIVTSIYLGDVRQYVCRLDGSESEWRVAQMADGTIGLGVGDPVQLTFSPKHVAFLENGGGYM